MDRTEERHARMKFELLRLLRDKLLKKDKCDRNKVINNSESNNKNK